MRGREDDIPRPASSRRLGGATPERQPEDTPTDFALALSAAAFAALHRFKADVLLVVIAGNAVGLFRALLF